MILPPDRAAVNSPDGIASPDWFTCPDCGGRGRVGAISCSASSGCSFAPVSCRRCAGSGRVSPERAASIAEGERLRADRVGRRLSLNEEAARLGIDARVLHRREKGGA
jgi:hypothetical protein